MKLTLGETFEGPAGKAEQITYRLDEDDRPDQAATLASYFLTCPKQSPAWDSYLLSVIHLRDIEGVKPAHKRFPEATHEVLLMALDPDSNPGPLNLESFSHYLTPINLTQQVQLNDDEEAKDVLRMAARAVVDGRLWAEPPLSGQTEPWATVLKHTAEHFRTGHITPADGEARRRASGH